MVQFLFKMILGPIQFSLVGVSVYSGFGLFLAQRGVISVGPVHFYLIGLYFVWSYFAHICILLWSYSLIYLVFD